MCFAQYDSEPDETIFLHLILHNPYFLSYILHLEINLNICLLSFSLHVKVLQQWKLIQLWNTFHRER